MTLSHLVWGQSCGDESAVIPRARAVESVEETGRVLNNAAAAGRSEAERVSLDQSAGRTRLDQAVAQTQNTPEARSGTVEKNMIDEVNRKLAPALSRVAPEGKALLAQSSTAPAMRAPDSTPATPVKATAVADDGAAPIPLVRTKRDSESAAPAVPTAPVKPGKTGAPADTHIDIVSQGALYFDPVQSLAVFTDDVVVDHPQFHLTSDELQVYMLKDGEANPKADAVTPPATPGEAPKPKSDSSVKQAIATGRKVVIQKLSEKGEMQIGICRHATYIGENGDIILREMPQVQRSRNLIIATDPATYMILKQNGELKVFGPNKVKIIQEADKKAKDPAAATADQPVTAPKPPTANKPGTPPKTPVKKKDKGVIQ